MKIIYLHQYFNTLASSSATRSYEMARRLAERGHEVHIVTSSRQNNRSGSERMENFTVHWHPVPYSQQMTYRERVKAFLTFAIRSAGTARRLRGDVVFATSTPLTVAIPGVIGTIFRKTPLVFEVRDLWPDVPIALGALNNKLAQLLAQGLERATYSYASQIVALSPDMKRGILAKNVVAEKVHVISNASDNELFQSSSDAGRTFRSQHRWLKDRKLVLYCGSLGKVNEVSYVARLAAAMWDLDHNIRFLVVGKGNDEERVRETAERLGVYKQNFFMMEPVPKREVSTLFAAADVSMSTVANIPILAANSANKVFDTFASATPLVINHRGWLAKLLGETQAGLVLPPSDISQAAMKLRDFLHSSETLEVASKAARSLATGVFDREKLADQLGEVLEETYRVSRSEKRRTFPNYKKQRG